MVGKQLRMFIQKVNKLNKSKYKKSIKHWILIVVCPTSAATSLFQGIVVDASTCRTQYTLYIYSICTCIKRVTIYLVFYPTHTLTNYLVSSYLKHSAWHIKQHCPPYKWLTWCWIFINAMRPATMYAKRHVCKIWHALPSKQGRSARSRRFLALSFFLFHNCILLVPSFCFSHSFCNGPTSSALEMRMVDAVRRRLSVEFWWNLEMIFQIAIHLEQWESARVIITGSSQQWSHDK